MIHIIWKVRVYFMQNRWNNATFLDLPRHGSCLRTHESVCEFLKPDGMAATSSFLPSNLENADNLTDLEEIRKAYEQLCKEEVMKLVVVRAFAWQHPSQARKWGCMRLQPTVVSCQQNRSRSRNKWLSINGELTTVRMRHLRILWAGLVHKCLVAV